MTDTPSAPLPASIHIFVVSHTNVGKTALVRTLLGKDVGEVQDAPDVTQTVTPYELVADETVGTLQLWDTPGFGDSFRLAGRLRRKNRTLAWLVREAWEEAGLSPQQVELALPGRVLRVQHEDAFWKSQNAAGPRRARPRASP